MASYDRYSDYSVDGKIRATKQASVAGDVPILGPNGKLPADLMEGSDFEYKVLFDSAIFMTDPTGCLAYSGDAKGNTPISNLNNDLDIGSFDFATNPMTRDCYYATIAGDGEILSELDPYDLTKDIDGHDRTVEIESNNTMLVVPTRYSKRNASGISLSSKWQNGRAYAHMLDDHTYKHLALGVYEGSKIGTKLMSVSGQAPAQSITRPNFRIAAQANGPGWHLTNWHEWQLYKDMVFMGLKSFDGGRRFGEGNTRGNVTDPQVTLSSGMLNTAGPYAGTVGESNPTSPVKILIENPWGNRWQFLDDLVVSAGYEDGGAYWADVYAGQTLTPTDLMTDKVKIGRIPMANITAGASAFATAIDTSDMAWGLFANNAGSDSTGLCDKHWYDGRDVRLGLVGGSSADGSYCGVSALVLYLALSGTSWNFGARVAFVFD